MNVGGLDDTFRIAVTRLRVESTRLARSAALRAVFPCEIDHGAGPVEFANPLAGCRSVGVPHHRASGRRCRCRPPRQDDDLVTLPGKMPRDCAAEKSRSTGEDHLHEFILSPRLTSARRDQEWRQEARA